MKRKWLEIGTKVSFTQRAASCIRVVEHELEDDILGGRERTVPQDYGTIVKAVLPAELIGEVPASFQWGFYTRNWSGPMGSNGNNPVDLSETTRVSNP